MGKRNSNFQFRFSLTHAIGKGIRTFIFVFVFVFLLHWKWIPTSVFVFRFHQTLDNKILIVISFFRLSFYKILKNGIWTLISFSVSLFLSLSYVTWIGKILALPVANNRPGNHILDEVFVRRFLTEENNSYEDLLEVIKKRYPNLRGCTVVC